MITRNLILLAFAGALCVQAQRQVDVKGSVGMTGFGDEGLENHLLLSASSRVYLTRRLSIEPEFQYLRGEGRHYDIVFAPAVVWDFGGRRVVPYVLAAGGVIRSSFNFGGPAFSTTEGFFSGGGGVKVYLDDRWFVAPEARIGWEPHIRLSIGLGYSWRP